MNPKLELAQNIMYCAVESLCADTGISKSKEEFLLLVLKEHDFLNTKDLYDVYLKLLADVKEVKKTETIDDLVYDDYFASVDSENNLLISSTHSIEDLNKALKELKSNEPVISFKRKSRNLKIIIDVS